MKKKYRFDLDYKLNSRSINGWQIRDVSYFLNFMDDIIAFWEDIQLLDLPEYKKYKSAKKYVLWCQANLKPNAWELSWQAFGPNGKKRQYKELCIRFASKNDLMWFKLTCV